MSAKLASMAMPGRTTLPSSTSCVGG